MGSEMCIRDSITHVLSFGPQGGVTSERDFLLGHIPGTPDWPLHGNANLYEFELTEQQYNSGTAQIDDFRQDVPNYTPFTHCTTSARDISINGFGINLPSGRGPVRVGETRLPFEWTNPQTFDEALQEAGLEPFDIDTSEFSLNGAVLESGTVDPLSAMNSTEERVDTLTSTVNERTQITSFSEHNDDGYLSLIAVERSARGGVVETIPTKHGRSQLIYTPPEGFTGSDTIRFSSIDENGDRIISEITITVSEG